MANDLIYFWSGGCGRSPTNCAAGKNRGFDEGRVGGGGTNFAYFYEGETGWDRGVLM